MISHIVSSLKKKQRLFQEKNTKEILFCKNWTPDQSTIGIDSIHVYLSSNSNAEEGVKIRFGEILKFNVFQDPYLNEITCTAPFRLKTYLFKEIVIQKQQNAQSVTDASILVNIIFLKATCLK